MNEYAGLREQAQGFDPVQMYEARQAICPTKEQEAENCVQEIYGEKYNPLLMFDSKKAVSRMLNEDIGLYGDWCGRRRRSSRFLITKRTKVRNGNAVPDLR